MHLVEWNNGPQQLARANPMLPASVHLKMSWNGDHLLFGYLDEVVAFHPRTNTTTAFPSRYPGLFAVADNILWIPEDIELTGHPL